MEQTAGTFVALDLGTTKTSCLIAVTSASGGLQVVGVGNATNEGLPRGEVVDVDKAAYSIRCAVKEAEGMAGVSVRSVCASIGDPHMRGVNGSGATPVQGDGGRIDTADVTRAVEAAKMGTSIAGQILIDVLPQDFEIDGEGGITNPIGRNGGTLTANVHIIGAAVTAMGKRAACVQKAGLAVEKLVIEPLASSRAVLDPNQHSRGVAVIDIGGGTTGVAVFLGSTLRQTAILETGGAYVTSDVAIGLGLPIRLAELLKLHATCSLAGLEPNAPPLMVSGFAGMPDREVSQEQFTSIAQARMEEILTLAWHEVSLDYSAEFLEEVVITGGTSLMAGIVALAEEVFGLPVRVGTPGCFCPGGIDVADPRLATCAGLIVHAMQARDV
jgi:cell division protein FtsA